MDQSINADGAHHERQKGKITSDEDEKKKKKTEAEKGEIQDKT